MKPQLAPRLDSSNTALLRSQTASICESLQNLIAQVNTKAFDFDGIVIRFGELQPTAYALARAMTDYVPDNDPRITVFTAKARVRTFTSDDLNTIAAPLRKATAATHLETIIRQLQSLICYLPTESAPS